MRFYVLENPTLEQSDAITDFLPLDSVRTGDAPECPACGEAIGMLRLLPPIQVELKLWGRGFGDLSFGPGNEFLVSERFKDTFLKAGLTGLPSFTPVKIAKVKSRKKVTEPVPRYFAVLPVRSRTAIDDRACGMVREAPWTCHECRTDIIIRFKCVVLEERTWSGEDVFFARGLPGTVITSERFKEFCDKHAFRNCLLIEADRFGLDFEPE